MQIYSKNMKDNDSKSKILDIFFKANKTSCQSPKTGIWTRKTHTTHSLYFHTGKSKKYATINSIKITKILWKNALPPPSAKIIKIIVTFWV